MSNKGCLVELALGCTMLAIMGAFVWADATQDLAQFGTVQHMASDGTVKENPICLLGMIGATAVGIVIAAMMLRRAEKKVIEAGDVAERHGGDPLPGVTKTARSGCGTAIALMSLIFVCGLLTWIAAMMGGL